MSKTQIGPWLGFINSGRFKHKGFEKNAPVIILSLGDNGYGVACRVVCLHDWWKKQTLPNPEAKFHWVKASAVNVAHDETFNHKDVKSAQSYWENGMSLPGADKWPTVDVMETLIRLSHNWSSEWQTGFTTSPTTQTQEAMSNVLVQQGYLRDQQVADEFIKFYGQVVRNTDKAMLVSVGPDKEEHWFPKSQTEVIGYLTDRPEQYVMTTKNWQLRSKVGDGLCETFRKAQKAIDKHGTMRNPMGVGEDGEIKSPGLGI